ncbi:MAG: HAMP domain-containing histidine kinase [Clostridiales bacterium]|nr:HAMP domain-containing histidine kinase [Clostridiales bacterium]
MSPDCAVNWPFWVLQILSQRKRDWGISLNKKLFIAFFKERLAALLLFLLFCFIFALVFVLFQIEAAAVLYAGAICAFIGAVYLILQFIRFCKKHRRLQTLLAEITVTADNMPAADSVWERDYQAIVHYLWEELHRQADEENKRFDAMIQYYTTWVHQIKTPIAALRMLLPSSEAPAAAGELQKIEQYVEMVLCYLRLDSDVTDYVIKEYDLDEIVKQAVRKQASFFIGKKIALSYEPLHTKVLTDEKWLLFVIEQILSNALKYTKAGQITITLKPPKVLCIEDTGIGIAPEDLPRIFESGFTGYNGRIDQRASGLGLSLCRRICKNLGHTISASSEPGKGTCVQIDLDSAPLKVE